MGEVQAWNIAVILSSVITGLVFGFILQRGRYCMNSAFRNLIFTNDFTLFRSYLLSLIIAIIGANLLEDLGFMGEGLRRQAFAPFANIVGGYIFGIGIVMAGGSGSGVFYKTGEGLISAFITIIGFVVGIVQTSKGILSPLYARFRSFKVGIGGEEGPALWDLFGGPWAKWIIIAIIVVIILPYILKGKPFAKAPSRRVGEFVSLGGFSWPLAGLLIGLTIVFAWWASARWGGQATGLSLTGPSSEFFLALLLGDSRSTDQMFNFWNLFKSSWAALYIPVIPLGAYISAKGLKEFKIKTIPVQEMIMAFIGGLFMGFGAIIAGGCEIGHSLTGVSALSVASIITTIFIILGNWTMVYYKFIKHMKE